MYLRRVIGWTVTVLAAALVFAALAVPDRPDKLAPSSFLRIPLEALLGVALLMVLPHRARRPVAAVCGAYLGLAAIVKVGNMAFRVAMDRQFDLVLDWALLNDGYTYLADSEGRTTAMVAVVTALALVAVVPALMALATVRLSGLVLRHRTVTTRAALALAAAWVAFAVLGAQIINGVPIASRNVASLTYYRALQINAGLNDKKAFANAARADAFRDTPGDQLLTALRGKDVIVAFVESYGRDAVQNPTFAPQVGAVLDAGTKRLAADGYGARSGFLTSSTFGGGSWWAHATTLSGLWINNEQRYRSLIASDRLTLNRAFGRAGWRTVAFMPGITRAWPEGGFYGYDKVYDVRNMGYRGPGFGFATMPDQFVLTSLQRNEYGKAGRGPLMAELALLSSHSPWAPIPRMVDWDEVGDGSIFHRVRKEGFKRQEVWKDMERVRTEYRRSIEYSLNTLVSYVETYGDDDLVLVLLGDHQPSYVVVGDDASRDVPITVVARDRAVLDRIDGWGWHEGLKPGPRAPVWPMDTFRDRFLTAFSTPPS